MNTQTKKKHSLAETRPELAKQWHSTKNGELTPNDVSPGGNTKYWWSCPKDNGHEWQATCSDRTGKNRSNCPFCSGRRVHLTNCLSTLFPEIAKEWHPVKNNKLLPSEVTSGSAKVVWWQCAKNPIHEWKAACANRTRQNQGCPFCANRRISEENNLRFLYPNLAREWHPTKNNLLTPSNILPGNSKMVWWQCLKKLDHEWQASCKSRTERKSGCPFCKNRKISIENSLAFIYPDIAKEWHPTKNKNLKPEDIVFGSMKKIWWQCLIDSSHVWQTRCVSRTRKNVGCPFCSGHRITYKSSLAFTHPALSKEWNPTKNGELNPANISAGSNKKVWWICPKNHDHEWQAICYERASRNRGCPYCNSGWTIENIRLFIKSLISYIDTLTEVELYVLLQQSGLLNSFGSGRSFVQALKTGKFPKEELEKFINKEPSLVDAFLDDKNLKLESNENLLSPKNEVVLDSLDLTADELKIVETKDVLATTDNKIFANLDSEAVEFFIESAVAKIWRHAYRNEEKPIQQLEEYKGDNVYAEEVTRRFTQDYYAARNLEIPAGYSFAYQPSLMQRYTAYLVQSRKRIGNWSGTGAGKTLSAILASRIIKAKLTVVCCPNNVIDHWVTDIKATYPDSSVYSKVSGIAKIKSQLHHNYLILNYEFFQRPQAQQKLANMLSRQVVDLIVIDEIHFSKQREAKQPSRRKNLISWFLSAATTANSDLHVLGMSATPVINNLFEGKTLIELVTGISHDEIGTKPTVPNCISMYQKFITYGIRWIPDYKYTMHEETPDIDCSEYLPAIRQAHSSIIDLEGILTRAKTTFILQNIKPKTLIYTHYVTGIVHDLQQAIEQQGWRVAIFTGEHKDGLNAFIQGNADVLIASSCIGTGVDGLQKVCNRLIISCLPWTHAEYKQLIGRIYRQGQKNGTIDVIIPITYAQVDGQRWSWCDSRWKRIQFKKSISDAAVDGVVPEGHLRSPAQAHKDIMAWLERLDRGQVYEVKRQKIMPEDANIVSEIAIRRIGDLSRMNQRINRETSQETHQKFLNNIQEWHDYHATYRETRKEWEVIPYQEAIKWCKARPHLVIGDFGCGEAIIAQKVPNKVYSFDHIAINDKVVSCDISSVPLENCILDAVIFSLSLMGTNWVDYLKEGKRCLKLDGHLYIAEPTSRIKDIDSFKELLERLGFDIRRIEKKLKFTFIEALKSDRESNDLVVEYLSKKQILV